MLIVIKCELQCSLVYRSTTSELLSIGLHHKKSASIILSTFYRPPNYASAEYAKCVFDQQHYIRNDHQTVNSGDINLPDIDWSNRRIKSYQYPKSMSLEFLELPRVCDLEQIANCEHVLQRQ